MESTILPELPLLPIKEPQSVLQRDQDNVHEEASRQVAAEGDGRSSYRSKFFSENEMKISQMLERSSLKLLKRLPKLEGSNFSNSEKLPSILNELKLLEKAQMLIDKLLQDASESEERKKVDALKGFAGYGDSSLPPIVSLLNMDGTFFTELGLVALTMGEELSRSKKQNYEQLKTLDARFTHRVKGYTSHRTDTNLKRTLFQKQENTALLLNPALERVSFGLTERKNRFESLALKPDSAEASILHKMRTRIDFLRNPRFPHPPTTEYLRFQTVVAPDITKTYNEPTANYVSVVAEPPCVVFRDYLPHQSYKKLLTLRNVSSMSKRLRISPKKPYDYSEFFTYQLRTTPLKEAGLIGPGLSCVYEITFTPNSLGDFHHTLLVNTECGESFEVHILAQREPSKGFPEIIDCGPVMSGDSKVMKFSFSNSGGPGKFLLIPEEVQDVNPFELFSRQIDLDQLRTYVSLGPFQISPTFFELKRNQNMELLVEYSPESLEDEKLGLSRIDSALLRIACDNCQLLSIPVSGIAQVPCVKVCQVDFSKLQASSYTRFNENGEVTVIDFGSQHPQAKTNAIISVSNVTQLELDYEWVLEECGSDDDLESCWPSLVPDTCFMIHPSKGVLSPLSQNKFELAFCPQKCRPYQYVAKLYFSSYAQRRPHSYIPLNGCGIPYAVEITPQIIQQPMPVYCGESFIKTLHMSNNSVSPVAYVWRLVDFDPEDVEIMVEDHDGILNEMCCKEFQIKVTPRTFDKAIYGKLQCMTANGLGPVLEVEVVFETRFPSLSLDFDSDLLDFGLLKLGDNKKKQLSLINRSKFALEWALDIISCDISNSNTDAFIRLHPDRGVVSPGQIILLDAELTPCWYMRLNALIQCSISAIQFDTVIVNCISRPIAALQVTALVETPELSILNPTNQATCFVGVPFVWHLTLQNNGLLPATFMWEELAREQCSVEFIPSTGSVIGLGTQEIFVKMTFQKVGYVSGFKLSANVEDMVSNGGILAAAIDVDVVPMQCKFRIKENERAVALHNPFNQDIRILPETAANLRLDFGQTCPIFATRSRTIIIHNKSAISAPFRVDLRHFSPTVTLTHMSEDSAKLNKNGKAIIQPVFPVIEKITSFLDNKDKSLLQKTATSTNIGFTSSAGKGYIDSVQKVRKIIDQMQGFLADGKGAAFVASPASGVLLPWKTVEVKVTSYNNLVGLYNDELLVTIGDTILKKFNVRLGVVGSPIKFSGPQLVARKKEDTVDRINFGSRIVNPLFKGSNDGVSIGLQDEGAESIECYTKKVLIENQSPRDIVLKWKIFTKNFSLTHGDLLHKETKTNEDFSEFISKKWCLPEKRIGIIDVYPSEMRIPAFKSSTLVCRYRSAILGTFDALLITDVEYIDPNTRSSPRYVPTKRKEPTDDSQIFEIGDLSSTAKLLVHAKCIEPRLTILETNDVIRMKISMSRYKNVQKIEKTNDVFLTNNSDAICFFSISTDPANVFDVIGSHAKVSKQSSKGIPYYELNPTEQLLTQITCRFDKSEMKSAYLRGQLIVSFTNGMNQSFDIHVQKVE